ncbi:hypothetical protein JOM56_010282 [Amanita muscaria]
MMWNLSPPLLPFRTETVSSVSSTPKVGLKPLPTVSPKKSYANATKTSPKPPLPSSPNVVPNKSPKEIIRNKEAKSCTNKGTPSNVLVLSDFNSANKAGSYERIAEMRKKVNDILVDNKCKSISWSSRGNLVTKCNKSLSERDRTDIINSAKATFENNPTVLNKDTISYVKFIDVPLYDTEGTPFDNNDFNVMIQQSEKWSDVNITRGPNIIVKKNTSNAKKATIKVGFTDDNNSATAKRILKSTILFGGIPIRCKPWTSLPPAPSRKRAPDASIFIFLVTPLYEPGAMEDAFSMPYRPIAPPPMITTTPTLWLTSKSFEPDQSDRCRAEQVFSWKRSTMLVVSCDLPGLHRKIGG